MQLWPASVHQELKESDFVVLARYIGGAKIEIVRVWRNDSAHHIKVALPFEDLWKVIATVLSKETRANQLELFIARGRDREQLNEGEVLVTGTEAFRPGTYVFDQPSLVSIPVKHNNRAILIPRTFVSNLMADSLRSNNFVPSTTWFSIYAGLNPPDLYLSQKAEYEHMFSAYSNFE